MDLLKINFSFRSHFIFSLVVYLSEIAVLAAPGMGKSPTDILAKTAAPSQGNLIDLRLVQTRQYNKAWKMNANFMGGTFAGDPFQTALSYGATVGFYLGENIGVHGLYWKFSNTFNSAYSTLIASTAISAPPGFGTNSNQMQSLMGGEISYSLLYGKLSFSGNAILHFDVFLLAGAGVLQANTGATQGEQSFTTIAYWPGIGEQMYLTHWLALRADYQMMIYGEDVVERNSVVSMGTLVSKKTTFSSAFSVGFNFIFPP